VSYAVKKAITQRRLTRDPIQLELMLQFFVKGVRLPAGGVWV